MILENLEKLIRQLIKEEVAHPVLAKIDKSLTDYTCDCVELTSDGQETSTIYTRVQIPKLLASKDGGIYLTPSKGTTVLLNFLNGDRNFPVIAAVMGGQSSHLGVENKLSISANGKDLGTILVTMCDKISALTTVGSSASQTMQPSQIIEWKLFVETDIKTLFDIN